MNRRRLWASLLGCVGVTVLLLLLNLAFSNTPVLGLDLQGGVSVVLSPTEGATGDDLLVIRDLIRDELENRGIAEPDVRTEGSNIVVDLPGVKDQRDALDAVDVAGIVTLRPVFACAGPPDDTTTSTVPPDSDASPARRPGEHGARDTTAAPASTTAATAAGFGAPAGIARTAGAAADVPAGRRRPARRRAADDRARGATTVPGESPRPRPRRHRAARRRRCCACSTAARASSVRPAAPPRTSSAATAPTSS